MNFPNLQQRCCTLLFDTNWRCSRVRAQCKLGRYYYSPTGQ